MFILPNISLENAMIKVSLKYYHYFILMCLIYLLLSGTVISQQSVSAEFLSSLEPMSLSTGEKIEDGVRGVFYDQNKLYVTNIWAGIQCVNINDLKNPIEIGKYEAEHRPHNIYVGEKYCYVSDELEGVSVLDVSDPKQPKKIGQINTSGNAFWVEARYPYVYVAEENAGVHVYDITDIANPVHIGGFDTPGWAWYLNVQDNYVYVGDKQGGLQIIDFSDKANPVRLGQFQNLNNARTVFIDDGHAFIADGPNGMAILDVSNPKFPSLVSIYPTTGYIFDLFKAGKNIYLADEVNRRVDILNVADLKKPERQGIYQADSKVYSVWKEDVYLFVAADEKVLLLRHNNRPILADIPDQVVEENTLLNIVPNASEPDGDPIYFKIKNLPEGATFDSLTGKINWIPDYEQSGIYEKIELTVIEKTESKLSVSKSFKITVNHVNRPPTMAQVGDSVIAENVEISFVVGEGSDPDKEDLGKLTYRADNLPEGAIFDPITRKFTWTPSFEQSGIYTIDFVVNDPMGGIARDASTLTVSHVDRKPEIAAVENQVLNENESFTLVLSGTDPDKEDQNAITYKVEQLPPGAMFDTNTNTLSWTPTFDQSGEFNNILLIMTAGKLSDSTRFNFTVNHVNRAPELAEIPEKSIDENKKISFNITGNDKDKEDVGKLTYTTQNLPEGANFNLDSLMFSWTPGYDQSGIYDDLLFIVSDPSGLSDTQSVKITVNHVNRPPVLDELLPYSGSENELITFNITGSDPDQEDQEKLVFEAQNLPKGASFSEQVFTWTPSFDQSGEYEVTFNLSDGQLSDSKLKKFTINHVNRPPTLDSLPQQITNENNQLQFQVIGNDPDVEDAGKFILTASNLPEGANFDQNTGTFTWTPNFDQSGEYQVTFTNADPLGLKKSMEIKIVVNHVNRTPVLNPIPAQIVDENQLFSFVIPEGEDPDKEDAENLIYEVKELPEGATFDQASMTLTWTPGFEQSGEYTPVVTLTDGEFTIEQPLKITVNHVNRPPVIENIEAKSVNENTLLEFSLVAKDPDQEDTGKTKLTATELPTGAIFNDQTGTFSWTPTFEQSGNYQVNFTITDPAGSSSTQAADISVIHVNRPPVLNPVPSQTVAENTPVSVVPEASDEDMEDAGKLQFSSSNLPDGATLDNTTGSVTWTPNYLQAGNYNIEIKVTDSGGLTAAQKVEINVQNVNRPPTLDPVENKEVDENSSLSFSITGKDEDTDDELVYSLADLPDGAEFGEKDGKFSWTPDFNQAGTYNLTATLNDGEAESSVTFNIVVNNINRKPSIEKGESESITVGETVSMSFSASDPDDDQLTFSSDNLPEGATISSDGDFNWTPGENQTGTFVFTVNVSDGSDSDQTSASITVNSPPAPEPEPQQE